MDAIAFVEIDLKGSFLQSTQPAITAEFSGGWQPWHSTNNFHSAAATICYAAVAITYNNLLPTKPN
jgi:hypothetical protein